MFGALANVITGLVAILIGLLLTIEHVTPDLMVTLGLLLLIGGVVQLLLSRARQ